MLKNIIAISKTLSREEQKFVTGGIATFTHVDDGNKDIGELCTKGSSLPHLSCKSGLSCITEGHTNVGLCAVEVGVTGISM